MMIGMSLSTVNSVAMLMEMAMWDHFAVRNQNILALNPHGFQVRLNQKFQVCFQVLYRLLIPLMFPQAFPLNSFQAIHPKIQVEILQYFLLLFYLLNPQMIQVLSLHILQVLQSSQAHAHTVPTRQHLKLLNMQSSVKLLTPYWMKCAIRMMHGRRKNTVNGVAMLVEMVIKDTFAASHQNILALNPHIFQVWPHPKSQVCCQLFSFLKNLLPRLHPFQVSSLLFFFQAPPL